MDRTVTANISLSLDGRTTGPGGDYDMGWIVPHAVTDAARDHMIRVTQPATTALMGRKNFQGFGGYWPSVADDANADPRDRAFSAWLDDVEKVVFSTTVHESDWGHTTLTAEPPADVVRRLRTEEGGDIIVLSSSSVIRTLLEADEVDRLGITLCPTIVGAGARLFEDGIPSSGWTLVDETPTATGALCLLFDRDR